jgi:hypothetical protein
MKGQHICICLCEHCEQRGEGAFGPQPDGSSGVVVTPKPRRTKRRRRPVRSSRSA